MVLWKAFQGKTREQRPRKKGGSTSGTETVEVLNKEACERDKLRHVVGRDQILQNSVGDAKSQILFPVMGRHYKV